MAYKSRSWTVKTSSAKAMYTDFTCLIVYDYYTDLSRYRHKSTKWSFGCRLFPRSLKSLVIICWSLACGPKTGCFILIEFLAFILCISTHKGHILYIDWITHSSFLRNYYFINNVWKQSSRVFMIMQTRIMIMQTADVSCWAVNTILHFLSHNLKAYSRWL